MALTVAVVGHRPNRLPAAVQPSVQEEAKRQLKWVSEAVASSIVSYRGYFSEQPPLLRLMSGLAEGADCLVSRSGLSLGYNLEAILPFAPDEYERDFPDHGQRQEFRDLLVQAERVLVMPGERTKEALAYERAGLTIVSQADLVMAVWDGGGSGGRGGTTELLREAASLGIPIIHIDATGRQPTRVLKTHRQAGRVAEADLDALHAVIADGGTIRELLDLALRPPSNPLERAKLDRFLDEQFKSWNWRLEVPLLLAALRLRALRRSDLRPLRPSELTADLDAHFAPVFEAAGSLAERSADTAPITSAFGVADALANHYAQTFRGAYLSNFLFSALAVVAAAISLVGTQLFGWQIWPLAAVEMGLISLVFINTVAGKQRDWHGRWRDCREVAERLRASMAPWCLVQRMRHLVPGEPTWTGWYERAHIRAAGLRCGKLDASGLRAAQAALLGLLDAQASYHQHAARLMQRVEARLEVTGWALFGLTILFGGVNLATALTGFDISFEWQYVITGITASLPALGAATFGIRLIGDFEGVANRSAQTAATLSATAEALREDVPNLPTIRLQATSMADCMLGDVSQWRLATESRKLVAPG